MLTSGRENMGPFPPQHSLPGTPRPPIPAPPHFHSGSPESGPRALELSPFKPVTQRWALPTPRPPHRPLPKVGAKGRAKTPCLGQGLGVRQRA